MKEKQEIKKEELEKIRSFARKELKEEEIYTFSLILCDNDIDRDMEKFPTSSLEKLSKLFVGKTGGFDHNMSSKDQTARIYDTWVEKQEGRITADGEVYTCVRAKAYMLRNEKNKELIAEIDAGIKKETSVSCAVKSVKCSVCGKDLRTEGCEHQKGQDYKGQKCFYMLCDPEDAYEWSFVAVPAQKNAGVTKSFNPESNQMLPEWIETYRNSLIETAVKSAATVMPDLKSELLENLCKPQSLLNLKELSEAFEREAKKHLPLVRQLVSAETGENRNEKAENTYYMI